MLSYWASEQAHDPQRIVAICYRILKLKPDDMMRIGGYLFQHQNLGL